MKALKFGQTATVSVDLGDGPHVGISYYSSDTSIATVNSQGVVTPVVNPAAKATDCIISARETASTRLLTAIKFLVVPHAVTQERLDQINGTIRFLETIEDTTGPVGGSLDLSLDGTQLTVNFTAPTDPESGIGRLILSIYSSDGAHIVANKENLIGVTSPRIYTVQYGKSYIAKLRAVNHDYQYKELTASIDNLAGWNMAPWNTAPYGL